MKTLTIRDTRLPVVEFDGQRVVTLAMVDEVHGRPKGTASRNFQENRSRFIEGEDFYLVDFSKNNEFLKYGVQVPTRGLTILTESGYLMITKSLTDDLAWDVQRQLVNSYFRVEKGLQSVESLSPAVAKQIGGMVKAVVHKQFEEALAQALPALVHGEIAKHNLSVRYGCTSGQIWRKHGLPSEGMRGAANWLGNRLAERGCAVIDNGRAEMGGRLSRLFDPDRADVAMRGGLRSLCDRYVAERRGQKKLFSIVTTVAHRAESDHA